MLKHWLPLNALQAQKKKRNRLLWTGSSDLWGVQDIDKQSAEANHELVVMMLA